MPIIDVQVHPFDRNHPGRPWASPSHGLNSATGEEMVAAMNSVGVDGAIMVSSFSAYEYDPSYAREARGANRSLGVRVEGLEPALFSRYAS